MPSENWWNLLYSWAHRSAVVGITETKFDKSIFPLEIQIYNYDFLRCDRNGNGGGAACYIRSDMTFFWM